MCTPLATNYTQRRAFHIHTRIVKFVKWDSCTGTRQYIDARKSPSTIPCRTAAVLLWQHNTQWNRKQTHRAHANSHNRTRTRAHTQPPSIESLKHHRTVCVVCIIARRWMDDGRRERNGSISIIQLHTANALNSNFVVVRWLGPEW